MTDTRDKPLLDVRGMKVGLPTRRGHLPILNGVDLHVKAGEVLGVVGESGAGKSITGLAVIGLLEPPARIDGGDVWFDGRRIDSLSGDDLRKIRGAEIGVIFQDPLTSLNPLYTIGYQLVETIRTHLDMSAEDGEKRAVELLDEVGIPAAASRLRAYPHEFSGGMRQRVVIALALCANPRLIIADEPTTALDVSIQAQIIALLKRLCREHGTAVMLITHDMGVIAETADRVSVMYAGRVIEEGPVAEVVRNASHPYSRGLMGSIPVIGERIKRLPQIRGAMPRVGAVPKGCAFAPRCPLVRDLCRSERPAVMPGRATSAACWQYSPRWEEANPAEDVDA
ncbi:MAG: ABC transporter ATP-binding protein [Rhodospirillaceae bacterium]|nr:ABC transporter ATP-binding protein [Rhodospirillaceae bacterium]MCY4310684.1 ABC transporter ATP-binding protein [Rhodospirillaceae bacterium]